MSRDRAGVLDATVVRLLLTSSVVALSTSGFIFAVPFYILARLGRTDAVGTVVAIWTAGYIVSCLLSQQIVRRLSPRTSVTIAIIGVGVFMFLFRFTWTVPQMSVLGLFYGLFLGGVWAPLMGWLSGDAEGVVLSRRLGFFNISWSISVILAPLLASYLVKQSVTLPFGVMTAIIAVAGLVVLTTRYQPRRAIPSAFPVVASAADKDSPPIELDRPVAQLIHEEMLPLDPAKMRYIRYLAWIGAAVAYTAISVFRYQMPHLAKTIHMDEIVFGRVAVSLSLAITIAFFVLARWTGWHGKTRWIFLPQILLVVASGLLTWATSAWAMVPLMLAAGFAAGLLYASSVFYGSLGAAPAVRTRRMAIHEICLNIGVILGSYLGNLLSQHLGPSRVYPYLAAAVGLMALIQAIGWNLLLARHARNARLAAPPTSPAPAGLNPALTQQE